LPSRVYQLIRITAQTVAVLLAGRLAAGPGTGPAQDYLVRSFTADDGLRSDTLYDVAQDRVGYLWCASAVGLVRFDGARFTVFDRDNTPGFETRSAYSVRADEGGLWVVDAHFKLSHWEDGRLRPVPLRGAPGQPPEAIHFMRRDSRGSLWIRSREGHSYVLREGLADPEPMTTPASLPLPWPGNGPDWHDAPGSAPNLSRYGLIVSGRFVGRADPEGVTEFREARCFPRVAGGLWMLEDTGTELKVRVLSPAGEISAPRHLRRFTGPPPSDLLEDWNGNLWAALPGSGLARIGPDGEVRIFTRRDGLRSEDLRALLLDREGNVWAATSGGGLSRITRRRFQMLGLAEGLRNEIIYSVIPVPAASGGGLWVASHGGGVQRYQDGRFSFERGFDAYPWALHLGEDGALWVGDLMNGLGTLRSGLAKQVIPGRQFDAICDDPSGGGWAGGQLLCRWRGESATVVTNWPGAGLITSLACARDGTLYLGTTDDGLWLRRDGKFERLGLPGCPAGVEISALHLDSQGELWVGTAGQGLFRFHAGRFTAVTERDGLADRSVLGIAEDGIGSFWFTALGGIFRISRHELEDFCEGRAARVTSFRFGLEDGLAALQCTGLSQPKIARTADGRMWFATMRGLASTDPASISVNHRPPPVVIERFDADGQPLLPAGNPPRTVSVAAGTRRIEVQFTALSLTAPGRVRFRHRFAGRDTGWTEASPERRFVFGYLPPGPYRFQVAACNQDGVWNEEGSALDFVVQPFFWQTLWFRCATGGGVLALALWSVRWLSLRKVRNRVAQLERQQAVDRERARIARDMHDHIGSTLTQLSMISAPVDAPGGAADPGGARLAQVAELSREIVGTLDELVWTVNPRHDTTTGLVDYLSRHADEVLRPLGVRLRYDITAEAVSSPVPADRRHQLFLAFKEAVNNIVKHAGATEVWMRARTEAGVLQLVLEDNGRGLAGRSQPGGGDGLENMAERLRSMGGTCVIGPGATGGTRVEFRLPTAGAFSLPAG
jgi:signal transduction histidine kinase/ligand-binding sensor domain-containing protein